MILAHLLIQRLILSHLLIQGLRLDLLDEDDGRYRSFVSVLGEASASVNGVVTPGLHLFLCLYLITSLPLLLFSIFFPDSWFNFLIIHQILSPDHQPFMIIAVANILDHWIFVCKGKSSETFDLFFLCLKLIDEFLCYCGPLLCLINWEYCIRWTENDICLFSGLNLISLFFVCLYCLSVSVSQFSWFGISVYLCLFLCLFSSSCLA